MNVLIKYLEFIENKDLNAEDAKKWEINDLDFLTDTNEDGQMVFHSRCGKSFLFFKFM